MWNKFSIIDGLEDLLNLEELFLDGNKISEISGIENLVNLHTLTISFNQIIKISGLGTLKNLKRLRIDGNRIPKDLINKLGGFIKNEENLFKNNEITNRYYVKDIQKFIDYCLY